MRIKILYFHHAIRLGGAPKSLAILIQALDKKRFEPIVVMPKRSCNTDVKKLFLDAGAKVIEENHMRPFHGVNGSRCDSLKERAHAIFAAFPTAITACKKVRQIKPDLVHLNTSVLPFAGLGVKMSRLGIPVITHVRESVLTNWWGRMLSFFNRRFSDWYIGIDRSGLEAIGVVGDRSTVVHNSVDTSDMTLQQGAVQQLRAGFNCHEDTVLFVSICRIMEANGSLEFSRFLADRQSDLPSNVRFVFCGFDNKDSEYAKETLAAIGQYEHAFAMDFSKEIGNLIGASDVILAPFTTSHSARAVIEGATLGKPALVTDLPNLQEQIQLNESGLVFRYDQPDSTIESIRQLADRKKTAEMGTSALKFAEENFSLKTNVAKIQDFYTMILEAK